VNSLDQAAERIIKEYVHLLKEDGVTTSKIIKGTYNYETVLSKGKNNVKLQVYFGKKGNKVVLQGNKESDFYQEVDGIIFGPGLFKASIDELSEPENYIGTDESGKGDYFGPLVIAGVYVNNESIVALKKAGVRDSKEIKSDTTIKTTSREIKKIVGNRYSLVVILPEKYNELYKNFRNVNRLLGWGHAKVLENILDKQEATEAISDKFGDEGFIRNSLQEKGRKITLHQLTRAERYTAVAAASILARDRFNDWFAERNKELNFQLPKGASNQVEEAAREIKSLYGEELLKKIAKLHFKTSKKI
jgi:ribonuclease HIII